MSGIWKYMYTVDQTGEVIEPELAAVEVEAGGLQDLRSEALRAEQADEGEGQHDAAHVRGHSAERRDQRAQPLRSLGRGRRVGEQRSEDRTQEGREQRELDRLTERRALLGHGVAQARPGEVVVHVDERFAHDPVGGQEQEHEEEGEERHQAEARPSCAGFGAGGRTRVRPPRASVARRSLATQASATIGPQLSREAALAALRSVPVS